MSSDEPYTFPAPIGGVPLNLDFAPSILFAALYGVLSILAIYRFIRRPSRTFITFASMAFVIERYAFITHRVSSR